MQNINILLVDKNLSYLDIAQKMLKFHDESYNIDVATTGEECFKKMESTNYDLILLDFEIDGNRGLHVLDGIVGNGYRIPLIMLLAEGNEEIAFQALEQGASDYIIKVRGYLTALPFTVTKVLERHKLNGKHKVYATQLQPAEPPHESLTDEGIYFILNRRCRFISSNKKFEQMLEFSEAEILELTLLDVMPKEHESQFNQWLLNLNATNNGSPFTSQLCGKYGNKKDVKIYLDPIIKHNGEISSYKGKINVIKLNSDETITPHRYFDQTRMAQEMLDLINSVHDESFSHLLSRITKTICHLFQFKRATLAILDPKRDIFVKQTMVGFNSHDSNDHILEVPRDIIDKTFEDHYKVKVMYFDQNLDASGDSKLWSGNDRRKQPRRPDQQWHPKDLILLNLLNSKNQTFGYISLDNPEFDKIPSRDIFYNLEICASMAAVAIQTYYRFTNIEKRNRRLTKQLLSTTTIFKLNQNFTDMLNEFVWSIKFSLEFNLVMLGLISVNSGKIELKAVACEDKIKVIQIKELKFALQSFQMLTQKQYRKGKSYLITKNEPVARPLKEIYYRTEGYTSSDINYWPWWALLVVPIRKNKENKIMGFLIVDDPMDSLMPSAETIHTLEILADQIAVAMDNRKIHLQFKEEGPVNVAQNSMETQSGIKKIVDKIFK